MLICEEDVQAIATHTDSLKTVARDVRIELEGFDSASCSGRARSQIRGCAICGCNRTAYARGYCQMHYVNRRRYKAKGMLPATWVDNALPGSVPDATGWELKRQAGGAT